MNTTAQCCLLSSCSIIVRNTAMRIMGQIPHSFSNSRFYPVKFGYLTSSNDFTQIDEVLKPLLSLAGERNMLSSQCHPVVLHCFAVTTGMDQGRHPHPWPLCRNFQRFHYYKELCSERDGSIPVISDTSH